MKPSTRQILLLIATLLTCSLFAGEAAPAAPILPKSPSENSARGEVLTRLRSHFMLGLSTSPGDKWMEETRAEGAAWDIRYMYFCGGANTPSNWKTWNQPAGAYLTIFLSESDKMGVIPCITYYQMLQSSPGYGKGGEDAANRINSQNPATMNAYFDDMKLVFQKCAEYRTKDGRAIPVIFHSEPDLWGYFFQSPEFAAHDADKIKIMVKSSGHADVAKFDDTVSGFGKAIVALRDRYAPNVILAWHVSRWGNPDPKKFVDFYSKCGHWDLFFADVSDRDSGWKLAHNYMAGGAWWKDKDFESYRDWSAEVHQLTGMNIMLWQVPQGNTIMASCNNTENHFMDNRPEYFLEDYPKNTHIAEWTRAGFIGILFGGGAGGCTGRGDGAKDGITNPTPIAGNKGEKAKYADDDGGYLRLRGTNYYQKGPVPVGSAKPKVAAAPVKVDTAPRPGDTLIAEWQPRLIVRINESAKTKKLFAKLAMGRDKEQFIVSGADEKNLRVLIQNNPLDYSWKDFPVQDRIQLIKGMVDDGDLDTLLLAALYSAVNGDAGGTEEYLAKASLKDSAAAAALKSALAGTK